VGLFIDPRDPTIWRGPIASNALKQLINDSDWGPLDYLFIDLPPGTSDIHLTLVQTLAVTGAIIVTTPQDVALNDAMKGIGMFRQESINVPVLGIVENMSWFTPQELPDNKYYIFGKGGGKTLADQFDVALLAQIPIVQSIRESGDKGVPQVIESSVISGTFKDLCKTMIKEIEHRNATMPPSQKVEIKTRSFIHKNK
jgi:ATP-binding protein involved in chromosome partitioning